MYQETSDEPPTARDKMVQTITAAVWANKKNPIIMCLLKRSIMMNLPEQRQPLLSDNALLAQFYEAAPAPAH